MPDEQQSQERRTDDETAQRQGSWRELTGRRADADEGGGPQANGGQRSGERAPVRPPVDRPGRRSGASAHKPERTTRTNKQPSTSGEALSRASPVCPRGNVEGGRA